MSRSPGRKANRVKWTALIVSVLGISVLVYVAAQVPILRDHGKWIFLSIFGWCLIFYGAHMWTRRRVDRSLAQMNRASSRGEGLDRAIDVEERPESLAEILRRNRLQPSGGRFSSRGTTLEELIRTSRQSVAHLGDAATPQEADSIVRDAAVGISREHWGEYRMWVEVQRRAAGELKDEEKKQPPPDVVLPSKRKIKLRGRDT